MYLLDTNIFIPAFQGNEPEASFLKEAVEEDTITISVVVIAEFYGKATTKEKRVFDKLISKFEVISIDQETAKIAGLYRKQFQRKTKQGFLLDCFLAAQAKVHNFVLVTNNRVDFPMKDISIISPSAVTSSGKH